MGQGCGAKSSKTNVVAPLVVGNVGMKSLRDFDIARVIGTGAYSQVKLAKHCPTGRPVALKVMRKKHLYAHKQVSHVFSEKTVLQTVNSPFIVQYLSTFQDAANLYCVMEFVPGGELFRLMCARNTLSLAEAKFYIAEVVLALFHLHEVNCVYRDLKPENLLITATGHLKLTDMGFTKILQPGERTFTVCGTPEYLAPEVINQTGSGPEVDWWQVGVLLFEMLTGRTPFMDSSPYRLYEKILMYSVDLSACDKTVASLLSGLLAKSPEVRFREVQITAHPFFAGQAWEAVRRQLVTPPYFPPLSGQFDTANFDDYKDDVPIDSLDESIDPIFSGY